MRKIMKILISTVLIILILLITINLYVLLNTNYKIKNKEDIKENDIDCIIVLGAGVRGDKPSSMLEDRLLTAIELYNKNISKKIIVTGDHGQDNYDEVNVMKNYLIKNNIPSENIFMDHAGFSTYDSIYRAKEIFKVNKAVVVTQKYHLYRTLHIAKKLNLETYGVPADKTQYANQIIRDIREIIARTKDFIKCIFKPEPKYLGKTIPVNGDGNITNDK